MNSFEGWGLTNFADKHSYGHLGFSQRVWQRLLRNGPLFCSVKVKRAHFVRGLPAEVQKKRETG